MSEELLKAILQLFTIIVQSRVTEDERNKIKEFLGLHLNRESINYYLNLFDTYLQSQPVTTVSPDLSNVDEETQRFVDSWSRIMQISKQVNQALTVQQKYVLIVKIIELILSDEMITERQENLIHYIGQALNVDREHIRLLRRFVEGRDAEELTSKDVLLIDEGSESDNYPGPSIKAKSLTGLIAILRVPDAEVYFIKYLGISSIFLNGIPLRSRKIDIFPTGSTIRGDKLEPIYYSDVIGKFLVKEKSARLTFTADHLFYHFKSGRAALQNITIAEQGGKLIGIMGASGSGKSTLLNVLNGTEKPSGGRVVVNGVDVHEEPDKVEGIIGYIPQDDLLMEDLTVYQNLYFAARLSGVAEKADAHKIVQSVLSILGLSETRDLKVGNALDKTISGGQRKRLNIGLELLREPEILFVDEPTSGLSSRDSENIMDLLKELSLRGKMIFVVIHQPSSDIFKMFDSLIILDSGGFQIYYGNPVEAITYFREIINAANRSQGVCPECGNINPEQIFNIVETKIVNEYGRLTNTRRISAGQWYQYFKQRIKIPRISQSKEPLPKSHPVPNRVRQFRLFITRDFLSKLANHQYLLINLLEAPILAFFISYMVRYYNVLESGGASYSFYDNQNIPVYFFMSVVVALFLGLTMSAEEIFRDRRILKREQFLSLSRNSYLMSKMGIVFINSAIQTVCFTLVGNFVLGIPLDQLRYWFILFSCSCFANMLGLNISASFASAVTIYILIPLLVIPQLLLSGIVISFDKFNPQVGKPVGVPAMGEIMASRWAFEAFMVTQFRDNPYERIFYPSDKKAADAEFKRVYLIPTLHTSLTYALNHRSEWHNPDDSAMTVNLHILHTEIGHELSLVHYEFPALDQLNPGAFDSTVYTKTNRLLDILDQYYANRQADAARVKDSIRRTLSATPAQAAALEKLRLSYENNAVIEAVKNINGKDRIVYYDGRLVRKLYPIYDTEHWPSNPFDFSANLFQPTKQFLGLTFNTLYFNLGVIWVMTAILYATLYFDALKKLVNAFENRRKYRRRVRD